MRGFDLLTSSNCLLADKYYNPSFKVFGTADPGIEAWLIAPYFYRLHPKPCTYWNCSLCYGLIGSSRAAGVRYPLRKLSQACKAKEINNIASWGKLVDFVDEATEIPDDLELKLHVHDEHQEKQRGERACRRGIGWWYTTAILSARNSSHIP
jgi:hypothetical protein